MIRMENVYKTFGTKTSSTEILSNVSLSVSKGSWVSIVGPSGSGKSTLLNIISGLLQPNAGNVFFNNLDMYQLKAKERSNIRRKKIGFVFQDFKLLPYYSVLDNVTLPRYDEKVKGKLYKRAKELLEMVGIQELLFSRLPEGLSGGEKQRVAIARALIANPDVLICDEPTGNLDKKNRDQIIRLLGDLNKQGKTIILVTHDLEAAVQGDAVYHLMNGTLTINEVRV